MSQTVLVTGAASGIGAAITTRFLQEGATVLATDISAAHFESYLSGLDVGLKPALYVFPMDVSSEQSVIRAFQKIEAEFPALGVVVNNAGIGLMGGVSEISFEQWTTGIAVDLNSVFLVSKAALPCLRANRGNIVNIASISGMFADHRMAAYNAAKGAVINLTRSLAVDYGPLGVRTNAVAPGPVKTPALLALLAVPSIRATWENGTPLGSLAEPEDVAAAVAFLASDDARHINGAVPPVDGGFTARTGQPDLAAVFLD